MAGKGQIHILFINVFYAFTLMRNAWAMPFSQKVANNNEELIHGGSKSPNLFGAVPSGSEKWNDADKKERHAHLIGIYKRFYEDETTGSFAVNDGLVQRMFDEKVFRELANIQKQKKEVQEKLLKLLALKENLHSQIWEALSGKSLEPIIDDYVASKSVLAKNVLDLIKSHLYEGSVVEIGTGMTVLRLAEEYRNFTNLAITLEEVEASLLQGIAQQRGVLNLFVGHVSADRLVDIAEDLYGDHQILFSNVLLTEVDRLVGNLLPHELEELLARLFSLTPQVYVANINTTKSLLSYFKGNWPDVVSLFEHSCQVASLHCQVQNLGWYNGWDAQETKTVYRVLITKGIRTLPSPFCEGVRPGTQCVLQFNNKSESVDIHFSDDFIAEAPTSPDTLSLHAMQKLGLIAPSAEQFILKSLKLPYKQDISARSIQAFGNEVIIYPADESQVPLDVFNETAVAHQTVANLLHGMELVKNNADPIKEKVIEAATQVKAQPVKSQNLEKLKLLGNMSNFDNNLHFQKQLPNDAGQVGQDVRVTKGVNILQQDSPAGIKGADSVVKSQVDGVAQRWKRVDGDIPTNQKKDQEQMKFMGRQWDRENVEGLAGGNPLKAKAQEHLRNLDKVINREVEVGDEDHVDIGAEVDQKGHVAVANDTVLSKDERDFQKAMGFLHGNSDVKELSKLMKAIGFGKQSSRGTAEQIKAPHPDKSVDDLIDQRDDDDQEKLKVNNQIEKPVVDYENEADVLLQQNDMDIEPNGLVIKQGQLQKPQNIAGGQQVDLPDGHDAQEAMENAEGQDGQDYDYGEEDAGKAQNKNVEDIGRNEDGEQNDIEQNVGQYEENLLDDVLRVQPKAVDEDDKRNQPQQGGMRKLLAEEIPDLNGLFQGQFQDSVQGAAVKVQTSSPVTQEGGEDEEKGEFNLPPTKFGPVDQEENLYDIQWPLIRDHIKADVGSPQEFFSVFTYGDTHQSLLGLKLARIYPHANVLSVMPHHRHSDCLRHRQMVKSLVVQNNLVLEADLKASTVQTISRLPELFQYQILGVDIYGPMVGLQEGFLLYIGKILSLAKTTFLEVPDPRQLLLLQILFKLLAPDSKESIADGHMFDNMIQQALRLANVDQYGVKLLEYSREADGKSESVKMLKVTLHSLSRQVSPDCSGYMAKLILNPTGKVFLSDSRGLHMTLTRAQEAFSLQLLLALNLENQPRERKQLFWEYMDLPMMEDMCPVHVVWFNRTLLYNNAAMGDQVLQTHKEAWRTAESQAVSQLLVKEMDLEPFSFMQYGAAPGYVILSLAEKYQNSTFLALADKNKKAAHALYDLVKGRNLSNIVVNNLELSHVFTRKLVESPEFLRYQFMGQHKLLQLGSSGSRYDFNVMLGQMLASSVTTFLQVPSDQMQSLAMTTFYPDLYHGLPAEEIDPSKMAVLSIILSSIIKRHSYPDWNKHKRDALPSLVNCAHHGEIISQIFKLSQHPLPLYRKAEFKMIGERAHAKLEINISAEVVHPALLTGGARLPWNLLRVDIRNLTALVHHHFDYGLDGHERTYTQHCLSHNKTHFEVYLTRTGDGYKIPFGKVHAITLIALLRMGLLSEIKADFYDKFIRLPYYEDMAPWNIVFNAGHLEYIDYDTKDRTFNHMTKAAFQVIFMLMNYERTIKDFGKCPAHARIKYGIDAVGKCVGSNFSGPCEDTRYPVPCGDQTCRSTYMECLEALNDLEKKKAALQKQTKEELKQGHLPLSSLKSPYEDGNWSFGPDSLKS